MAIITCKMCGGDIDLSEDMTHGTCRYCGSTMTLPKIDDEQRAAAFNRGNHFRRIGEFDKAVSVYERIINENNSDAEAHWCLALSRFGIEYVKDPASEEYIPTCHRASFDSFLEDVDYKAALEYSDGVTRRQYEEDAEKIMSVQKGLLAISQKEEKFDIFICYKESDDDGNRTKDSVLAQDIYYQLTEHGYRVFFSRITLEDKVGMEYEPYIFAALHSAGVMIVVGTKPEYLNAVWVKNEWSRYLALMKNDKDKVILPCYRDMDPYDMPEQLSILQAYDMGKIGFVQDLLHGIGKVLKKDEPKREVEKFTVVQGGGTNNWNALVKRGNMAIEDKEFDKADGFFEQALNQNAECGEAYWGKKLAQEKCSNLEELVQKRMTFSQERMNQIENDNETQWQEYIQNCVNKFLDKEETLTVQGIRQIFYSIYDKNVWLFMLLWEEQYQNVRNDIETDKLIRRALKYGTSDFKQKIRQRFDETLFYLEKKVLDEKSKETEYLNQIEKTISIRKGEYEEKFQSACNLFDKKQYDASIRVFNEIIEYKNSRQIIENITKLEEKYNEADRCFVAEDYETAIQIYTEIIDYKDSRQRCEEAIEKHRQRSMQETMELKYQKAQEYYNRKNRIEAYKMFKEIIDYKDSRKKIREIIWHYIVLFFIIGLPTLVCWFLYFSMYM